MNSIEEELFSRGDNFDKYSKYWDEELLTRKVGGQYEDNN